MKYEQRFEAAASEFADWVANGDDLEMEAVQNALRHINALQSLVLEFGYGKTESIDLESSSYDVLDDEWQMVFKNMGRIPFQYYSYVSNPLIVPADEPGVGDISDDIADIYRDTVSCLRQFKSGEENVAIYKWIFLYWAHWGEHATGALRTLYCYRRENKPVV